jgi:hypothetical protein
MDKEVIKEDYNGFWKDWKRRKKELDVESRSKKENRSVVGKVYSIKKRK